MEMKITYHPILFSGTRLMIVIQIRRGRDIDLFAGFKRGARGEEKTCSVLCRTGYIFRRDHAPAVGHRKVHPTWLLDPCLNPPAFDLLNRQKHDIFQHHIGKRSGFRIGYLQNINFICSIHILLRQLEEKATGNTLLNSFKNSANAHSESVLPDQFQSQVV
jgi:hypothetical protein